MKKSLFFISIVSILSASLSGAYVNIQNDGNWNDPSIWESPPEAGNGVNVRYSLTINQKLSDTYKDFVIGDSNGKDTFSGNLFIGPQGEVKLNGVFTIARNVPAAGNGTMTIHGGKVECGALNVGSGNNSPSTGILTLENRASLHAARTINVGSKDSQIGVFRLIGSKNSFLTATVTVRAKGTIAFIADADGFSTIKTTGRIYYDSTNLLIDGSNYKGPGKTFILIDAGNEGNTNYKNIDTSATITGFKGYKVRLFVDGKDLKLEVKK